MADSTAHSYTPLDDDDDDGEQTTRSGPTESSFGVDQPRKPPGKPTLRAACAKAFQGPLSLLMGITVYAASSGLFKYISLESCKTPVINSATGERTNPISPSNILFTGNHGQKKAKRYQS